MATREEMQERLRRAREEMEAKRRAASDPDLSNDNRTLADFGVITGRDFLNKKLDPLEMLLEPWFPVRGCAMTFAPSGEGKTHFALSDALAIAAGSTFLKWSAPEQRRVLYADGEMTNNELQAEITKLVRGQPEWERGLDAHFFLITPDEVPEKQIPDLGTAAGRKWIEKRIEITGADVLFLDSLRTLFHGIKENDADAWANVNDWLKALRRDGISTQLVHHSNKASDYAGSTNAITVLNTTRKLEALGNPDDNDGLRVKVSFPKHRGFWGPDAWSFEARLLTDKDKGASVWQYDRERVRIFKSSEREEAMARRAAELHKAGRSYRQIAEELNKEFGTSIGKDKAGELIKAWLAKERDGDTAVAA